MPWPNQKKYPKPKPQLVVPDAIKEMERFLPAGVIKAISQVDPTFDSQKLLESIIFHFGGPEKFAFAVVQEFKQAGPGTLVRQRILDMINRLTMNVSANSPPSKNAGDMDDDELLNAAGLAVREIDRKERLRAQKAADQGLATTLGQPGPVAPDDAGEEGAAADIEAPPRGRGRPKRGATGRPD